MSKQIDISHLKIPEGFEPVLISSAKATKRKLSQYYNTALWDFYETLRTFGQGLIVIGRVQFRVDFQEMEGEKGEKIKQYLLRYYITFRQTPKKGNK